MHFLHKHGVSPLHRYQLGVLFVYLASFLVFAFAFSLFEYIGWNAGRMLWYVVAFWAVGYTGYCLRLRDAVENSKRISPLKRPIGHWIILGLALVYLHVVQESEAQRLYPSVNASFMIFSLFLADSYWDFTAKKRR